jgi:hypothetical protein
MKAPVITCTTPYGVFTRATHRTYSHVVVVVVNNHKARAMAWCGSQRLAEGQMRYWLSHAKYRFADIESLEVHIFPVDGSNHG